MPTNKEIEQKVRTIIRAEYPADRQERLLTAWDTYKQELLEEQNGTENRNELTR